MFSDEITCFCTLVSCESSSPLVLHLVLEILTYLATHHSAIASNLFHFDPSLIQVVVYTATANLECQLQSEQAAAVPQDISTDEAIGDTQKEMPLSEVESKQDD